MAYSVAEIRQLLDQQVAIHNQLSFIANDPIVVPHQFSVQQDIEIAAWFAATIAWGNRTAIIRSARQLMQCMDNAPYDFIVHHTDNDLKKIMGWYYRTFQTSDVLYFIHRLRLHYSQNESLESAFTISPSHAMFDRLAAFHNYFFNEPHEPRTRKHVATPLRKSACKRILMFLRWMVRHDKQGVDFGLWHQISPADLMIPIDTHVSNIAFQLGLIQKPKADWQTVTQLTEILRSFDTQDPIKYDYALFGLGIQQRKKHIFIKN